MAAAEECLQKLRAEHVKRTREEIDAAYLRGFDDGRDSISALPVALVGAVSGALAMLGFLMLV